MTGTPINNSLNDLKSLVELLAVRTKKSGEKKERTGFTKSLVMLKQMKRGKATKEVPDISHMDFEYMINRKFEEIKEDRFPKLQGM